MSQAIRSKRQQRRVAGRGGFVAQCRVEAAAASVVMDGFGSPWILACNATWISCQVWARSNRIKSAPSAATCQDSRVQSAPCHVERLSGCFPHFCGVVAGIKRLPLKAPLSSKHRYALNCYSSSPIKHSVTSDREQKACRLLCSDNRIPKQHFTAVAITHDPCRPNLGLHGSGTPQH